MFKHCKTSILTAVLGLAAASLLAGPAPAADYGTITGKFVFSGDAPAMKKLAVTKDEAVCGPPMLSGETLVVGKGGAFANIVIYALGDPAKPDVPVKDIHPSYEKAKGAEVIFDNKDCRFEPHVVPLWTAQKLVIKNSDPSIGHNSFGQPFNNTAFNPLIPAGGSVAVPLPKAEKIPVKVTCSIHPWMAGFIVVRPDPYAAVTAADGTFKIANLPAGKHSFQLWHESLGYLKKVTLKSGPANDAKGIHAFEVKAGDNDLGEFTIKADDYKTQIGKLK